MIIKVCVSILILQYITIFGLVIFIKKKSFSVQLFSIFEFDFFVCVISSYFFFCYIKLFSCKKVINCIVL
jgi:hypothetical protein